MLADIQQAINIERKMNKSNKALKDIMARVVSDYNKMVSIKRHKIDGARRNLIYNLFLSQKKQSINESLDISQSLRVPCWRVVAGLSGCDFLKPAWTCCTSIMMAIVTNSQVGLGALGQNMFLDCFMVFSYKALCDYCWLPILVSECHCINPVGLPHDVLTHDFFVPGSTTRKDCDIYKGKELFSTILTTSPETCATYFKRAIEDGFVLSILCSWFFIPEIGLVSTYNVLNLLSMTSNAGVTHEDFCRRAGQSATVKKKEIMGKGSPGEGGFQNAPQLFISGLIDNMVAQ